MALNVAPELLRSLSDRDERQSLSAARLPPLEYMNKESQIRFTAIVLALFTVAAATFAILNFSKERQFLVVSEAANTNVPDVVPPR